MDWYYTVGSESRGPVDEATLRKMIAAGEIAADAQVSNESLPDWVPISRLMPPDLPRSEGRTVTRKKPKRRIARRLYFWLVLADAAKNATSMSFANFYFSAVGIEVSFGLFLGLFVLAPIAIIENKFAYSPRILVYIVAPVALSIARFALYSSMFTIHDVFGEEFERIVSLRTMGTQLSALLCVMIAVDGFARLREEALGNSLSPLSKTPSNS